MPKPLQPRSEALGKTLFSQPGDLRGKICYVSRSISETNFSTLISVSSLVQVFHELDLYQEAENIDQKARNLAYFLIQYGSFWNRTRTERDYPMIPIVETSKRPSLGKKAAQALKGWADRFSRRSSIVPEDPTRPSQPTDAFEV